jgi:NitT/TauT family transport system substrate-binding protein
MRPSRSTEQGAAGPTARHGNTGRDGSARVKRSRRGWVGLALALGMLLAACSGGETDDPTETATDAGGTAAATDEETTSAPATSTESEPATEPDGGGELTPVTVGILPIADLAPLYHAIDQGYFEEEGLDVSMEIGQGGAALVPAVVNGDYQFAFGNYVSLMLARQNNVGVSIVQNVVDGAESADRGTNALLVSPDSGIEDVEGLAGQRFAVSTINNVAEVTIRTTLRNAGVDDSGIEFVELPFPDMNAAVEAGEVDVAWQAEPFVTIGEGAGLVNVVDPMHGTMPSMPLAGMFASDQWLAENPDLAEAFVSGLRRGMEDASDADAMKAAIVANTQTDEGLADQIALANWNPDLDEDKLAEIGALATEYGILEAEPDMETLVWSGG